MKLDVTGMPKNMGQQTTNIQLFIAQIQSFAEGVSKTTKHKVLDLKQLKQSYSVVIQSKLLDIFLESHSCYFAHKIYRFLCEEIVQYGNKGYFFFFLNGTPFYIYCLLRLLENIRYHINMIKKFLLLEHEN